MPAMSGEPTPGGQGWRAMLTEEDFDLFRQFCIKAMGDRLREMIDDSECDDMAFEERIKILLDAKLSARHGCKVAKLTRKAGFKLPAVCVEDIIYLPGRKLSRDRVARLIGVQVGGKGRSGPAHIEDGLRKELPVPGAGQRSMQQAHPHALLAPRRRVRQAQPLEGIRCRLLL